MAHAVIEEAAVDCHGLFSRESVVLRVLFGVVRYEFSKKRAGSLFRKSAFAVRGSMEYIFTQYKSYVENVVRRADGYRVGKHPILCSRKYPVHSLPLPYTFYQPF